MVLLRTFAERGGKPPVFLRDLGAELGVHPKRVAYLASKWSGKGWYDWGVTIDLGWLTDKGRHDALALAASDLQDVAE